MITPIPSFSPSKGASSVNTPFKKSPAFVKVVQPFSPLSEEKSVSLPSTAAFLAMRGVSFSGQRLITEEESHRCMEKFKTILLSTLKTEELSYEMVLKAIDRSTKGVIPEDRIYVSPLSEQAKEARASAFSVASMDENEDVFVTLEFNIPDMRGKSALEQKSPKALSLGSIVHEFTHAVQSFTPRGKELMSIETADESICPAYFDFADTIMYSYLDICEDLFGVRETYITNEEDGKKVLEQLKPLIPGFFRQAYHENNLQNPQQVLRYFEITSLDEAEANQNGADATDTMFFGETRYCYFAKQDEFVAKELARLAQDKAFLATL